MLQAKTVSQETGKTQLALAERLNAEKHSEDEGTEQGHHPEGRKRGGLVSVYVEGVARAYYDETSCEWFVYDEFYDN